MEESARVSFHPGVCAASATSSQGPNLLFKHYPKLFSSLIGLLGSTSRKEAKKCFDEREKKNIKS